MPELFTAIGHWETLTGALLNGTLTIIPNTQLATVPGTPSWGIVGAVIPAVINHGALGAPNGGPLQLFANTTDLGLSTPLQYTLRFGPTSAAGVAAYIPDFTFTAPAFGGATYDVITGELILTNLALAITGLSAAVTGIPTRRKTRSLVYGLISI